MNKPSQTVNLLPGSQRSTGTVQTISLGGRRGGGGWEWDPGTMNNPPIQTALLWPSAEIQECAAAEIGSTTEQAAVPPLQPRRPPESDIPLYASLCPY